MLPAMLLFVALLAACSETPGAHGGATEAADSTLARAVAESLRTRLEALPGGAVLAVRGGSLHTVLSLPAFYERRGYLPAWIAEGRVSPLASAFVARLQRADAEGLRPGDYHLAQLESLVVRSSPTGPRDWTELDLLLTDAFFVYASHLLSGRINPETIDPEWRANRRGTDFVPVLERALADGPAALEAALDSLLPPQGGYGRMRAALARYRDIAAHGGWPHVAAGAPLRAGTRDPRVTALRERLRLAGDVDSGAVAPPDSFDAGLATALRRFQVRHGIEPSGIVDAPTLAELNVAPARRVRQLELNLERWRWLPQDLGHRHILVNIAGFELDVVEDGQTVLDMRVVVGRPYRRTPVFSDTMRYLVLSPYWHVPRNIAVRDKLPLIKRDPAYLAKQELRLFAREGGTVREVDASAVDWTAVTPANFTYELRQEPGPLNALGRVKFMFPNKYNVYLHDTPARELFARASRDFSSGCIRLEKPLELAVQLLRHDPRWTRMRLDSMIAQRVERMVPLAEPVPVHLLFWTAWAAPDGSIHFRRDLYGRDARLERALVAPAPQ